MNTARGVPGMAAITIRVAPPSRTTTVYASGSLRAQAFAQQLERWPRGL
jgi:hypothetical protein